ncbi:MAG: XRE family transcriptional regulator [Bacilli bacterium]|nr:XRE family transcriptional regulator [Bacilli bacterium]
MTDTYYLKIFDETLLSFSLNNDFGLKVSNIKIISDNIDVFPIGMRGEIGPDEIISFINSRIIPKNRMFVEQILTSMGLSTNDKKGIIDISMGLSLIDCYWIVKDNNLKFKDYNLYDNPFSEVLSLVAFTGYNTKIKELITSPELTTNGMLPKAWRRVEGKVYLYKGSTGFYNMSNTGFEPYSEFYCSEILRNLKYNHVDYDLLKWKGQIVSVCPIFTSKNVSYVQIGDIVKTGGIEAVAKFCLESGFYEEFSNLILFDSLTMNTDRHFGNFGVIRDNKTGKFLSLAPIFDNGNSLLSLELPKVFEDEGEFINLINDKAKNISYYGMSYDKLVEKYCNKKHIKDLRKLLSFKFTKHKSYNLSNKRLNSLSKMIRIRASRFIELLEKD